MHAGGSGGKRKLWRFGLSTKRGAATEGGRGDARGAGSVVGGNQAALAQARLRIPVQGRKLAPPAFPPPYENKPKWSFIPQGGLRGENGFSSGGAADGGWEAKKPGS